MIASGHDDAPPAGEETRCAFAHEAWLVLATGADAQAPGAAVTVALCGHWEHDGACRWPHRCAVVERSGETLALRVVFAAPVDEEQHVRAEILRALEVGRLDGPTGRSTWTLLAQRPVALEPDDRTFTERFGAR